MLFTFLSVKQNLGHAWFLGPKAHAWFLGPHALGKLMPFTFLSVK